MPFPLDTGQDFIEHHFRRRKFVWSEDFFLSILDEPRSKYDVYWSVLGLRKVGSIRSIPILVTFLTYPMQDVKCVAILTIAHIGGASVTPLFADALLSPNYREKTYAMWAILDAADDRAVPAVLQYFSKNRAKLQAGKLDTFGDGARYLAKFMSTSGEARAFVEGIPAYWTRIPEGTRQEMKKHIPELVAQIEADSSRYSS
jgi:hypothetical protein